MQRLWLNAAKKLEFRDPAPFLKRLRELELKVAPSKLPAAVKSLRTNNLKEWREAREAAIFCVGIGQRMGQKVFLAKSEASDYDFVASWISGDTRHFAPVQLKEVVPADVNAEASLQATIDSLPAKYVDSADLTVAIYLNQQLRFEANDLRIPRMRIAALWVFGGLAPDGSQWGLWGDFLDQPKGTQFAYPA
jgi:hypothetical protein